VADTSAGLLELTDPPSVLRLEYSLLDQTRRQLAARTVLKDTFKGWVRTARIQADGTQSPAWGLLLGAGAAGLGGMPPSSGNGETGAIRAPRRSRRPMTAGPTTNCSNASGGDHVHLGHYGEQPRRADFRAAKAAFVA